MSEYEVLNDSVLDSDHYPIKAVFNCEKPIINNSKPKAKLNFNYNKANLGLFYVRNFKTIILSIRISKKGKKTIKNLFVCNLFNKSNKLSNFNFNNNFKCNNNKKEK